MNTLNILPKTAVQQSIDRPIDLKDVISSSNAGPAGGIFQFFVDILVKIPLLLLPLVIIYGGLMYMLSMGNEEGIERAKSIIKWGIIGFIIYVLAFTIVTLVISMFGGSADPRSLTIPGT